MLLNAPAMVLAVIFIIIIAVCIIAAGVAIAMVKSRHQIDGPVKSDDVVDKEKL